VPTLRPALAAFLLILGIAAGAPAAPEVQTYEVPRGARPHDVAPAPDGKVWYTAQSQGALGILDPASGQVRQVPLGEGSAPHGVIPGPDGAAWITDGGQNAIVRFDPRTEKVDVWKLPDSAGRANLNTAAFDRSGLLWFTGQNGVYGRLDPKSGAVLVRKAPRGTGPYGITATPDGAVYYASLAGNHIARIDPATADATVIEPPTKDQGSRRIWSDSKGNLWVSEWNVGQLSRYTPASNQWKTWPLPGQNPAAYAVYVDDQDMVWVSDWGSNAVLRFDPKSEQFTPFPNSAPYADVRQLLGRPGELWVPESGLDRIRVIRTGSAG
jgi:Streptogramin lyase